MLGVICLKIYRLKSVSEIRNKDYVFAVKQICVTDILAAYGMHRATVFGIPNKNRTQNSSLLDDLAKTTPPQKIKIVLFSSSK